MDIIKFFWQSMIMAAYLPPYAVGFVLNLWNWVELKVMQFTNGFGKHLLSHMSQTTN